MTTTPPKLADEARRVEALVTRRMNKRHLERLDLPGLVEDLPLNAGVSVAEIMRLVDVIYSEQLSGSSAIAEGRPDVFPSAAPAGPGGPEPARLSAGQRAIARVEAERRRRYMTARRLPPRSAARRA